MDTRIILLASFLTVAAFLWLHGSTLPDKGLMTNLEPLTVQEASKVTITPKAVVIQTKNRGNIALPKPKAGSLIITTSATGEVTTIEKKNYGIAFYHGPTIGVCAVVGGVQPVLGLNVVRSDEWRLSLGALVGQELIGISLTKDMSDSMSIGPVYTNKSIGIVITVDL